MATLLETVLYSFVATSRGANSKKMVIILAPMNREKDDDDDRDIIEDKECRDGEASPMKEDESNHLRESALYRPPHRLAHLSHRPRLQ